MMNQKLEVWRGVLGTHFLACASTVCEFGENWQDAIRNMIRHSLSWPCPIGPGDRFVVGETAYDVEQMACLPSADEITVPGTGQYPYRLQPVKREHEHGTKLA
jgi:hypothetical protein